MAKVNEIQNERRNDDYTVIRRRDRRMDSLVTLLTVCVLVCVSSITSSNALLTPFPRRRGISRSSQPVIMWRGAATQSPLCQSPSPTTEISRPTNTSVVLVGDGNSDDDLILNGADESALELPIPTANGGFSHTNASKAKISAANRGKVPWNKGRAQSDAVRAKIAAGVQKRNREKFLKKLADQGLTEEEYNAQKEKEKEEKAARRTKRGGYKATKETKEKISRILKEKYSSGQIKVTRKVDPSKVRRGFAHTEETRRKISESLKKRWANDTEYRERMLKKAQTTPETRKRLSETLKKKWEDPVFRQKMMEKLHASGTGGGHSEERRRKISESIKAKWQTQEYRANFRLGLAKRAPAVRRHPRPKRSAVKKTPRATVAAPRRRPSAAQTRPPSVKIKSIDPITAPKPKNSRTSPATTTTESAPPSTQEEAPSVTTADVTISMEKPATPKPIKKRAPRKKKATQKAGDVELMREKRRDLYDLLYDSVAAQEGVDEDTFLDDFDPYGLEG